MAFMLIRVGGEKTDENHQASVGRGCQNLHPKKPVKSVASLCFVVPSCDVPHPRKTPHNHLFLQSGQVNP